MLSNGLTHVNVPQNLQTEIHANKNCLKYYYLYTCTNILCGYKQPPYGMCDYCNSIKILSQPRYINKYRNSKKNGKKQERLPTGWRNPTPTPQSPCWLLGGGSKSSKLIWTKSGGGYSIKGGVAASCCPVNTIQNQHHSEKTFASTGDTAYDKVNKRNRSKSFEWGQKIDGCQRWV